MAQYVDLGRCLLFRRGGALGGRLVHSLRFSYSPYVVEVYKL